MRGGGRGQSRGGVLGLGFRVSGFGFRVSGFGFRVSGVGFRVSGFGFRVSGFGFRVSGFRVRPCEACWLWFCEFHESGRSTDSIGAEGLRV